MTSEKLRGPNQPPEDNPWEDLGEDEQEDSGEPEPESEPKPEAGSQSEAENSNEELIKKLENAQRLENEKVRQYEEIERELAKLQRDLQQQLENNANPPGPASEQVPKAQDTDSAQNPDQAQMPPKVDAPKETASESPERPSAAPQADLAPNTSSASSTGENSSSPEQPHAKEQSPPQEQPPKRSESGPLVAMSVDMSEEMREMALDIAEDAVNEEVAQKGFITKLWKGTMMNRFYKRKYAQEYMKGDRMVEYHGQEMTLAERLERQQGGVTVSRFVFGAVEGAAAIHDKAGEKYHEADAETTRRISDAIRMYATTAVSDDNDLEALKHRFREMVNFQRANARDRNQPFNEALADNYLRVAEQARAAISQEIAFDQVMEGFKVYEGESRSRIRSAEHNSNLDKAMNFLEDHGLMVPAQAIAAGAGIASTFVQTGARAIGGVAAGIGASAVLSGAKAYNKATHDRQTMLRDAARGLEYSGTSRHPERFDNQNASKTAKYEASIGGSVYKMRSAADLTRNIEEAVKAQQDHQGDPAQNEALKRAIAEARIRLDFTDGENKDLITYSSPDKVGDESLALDIALIKAEKLLSPADRDSLKHVDRAIQDQIISEIRRDVGSKDAEFRKTRRELAVKQALKTGVTAAASFLVSQEVMAAFDPNKIGLLEKAGILKTVNKDDAQQTILTEIFTGPRTRIVDTETLRGDQIAEREYYKEHGYVETEVTPASTSTEKIPQDVPLREAKGQIRAKVIYANNGTTAYDGNELNIEGNAASKLISAMHGTSTLPDGTPIDFDQITASGSLRGLVTFGDGQQFLVEPQLDSTGQWVFGNGHGVYNLINLDGTPAGTSAFGNAFKTFSTGFINPSADGTVNFISGATVTGTGNFAGTIKQMVETAVENPPEYILTKVERVAASTEGFFIPETASQGLGAARLRRRSLLRSSQSPRRDSNGRPNNNPRTNDDPTRAASPNRQPRTQSGNAPNAASDKAPNNAPTAGNATGNAANADDNSNDAPNSPRGQSPNQSPNTIPNNLSDADRAIYDAINQRSNLFGANGVAILSDRQSSLNAGADDDRVYANWYNNLDAAGRSEVAKIADMIDRSGSTLGQNFMLWYKFIRDQGQE